MKQGLAWEVGVESSGKQGREDDPKPELTDFPSGGARGREKRAHPLASLRELAPTHHPTPHDLIMSVKRIAQRLPKLAFPAAARPSTPSLARATSSTATPPSPPSVAPSPSTAPLPSTPSSPAPAAPTASSSTPPQAKKTPKVKLSKADRAEAKKKAAATPAAAPPKVIQDLRLGNIGPNRFRDFYHNQLADDLLYLTYSHKLAIDPDLPVTKLTAFEQNPTDRYAINRPGTPRPKGRRLTIIPVRKAVTHQNVPRLESIVLSTTVKEATRQKAQLLGALHAFRTISGQVDGNRGVPTAKGVEVSYAKKGVAAFHVREGMAMGCKITLTGDEMWRFLETLVEFVLPRLREWKGIRLPQIKSEDLRGEWATQGVVSMGLDPPAMALFPQIEACLDAYPRLYGMNINFLTNQKGFGAADRARLLMSGFRVPFHRPDYKAMKTVVKWKKGKGRK